MLEEVKKAEESVNAAKRHKVRTLREQLQQGEFPYQVALAFARFILEVDIEKVRENSLEQTNIGELFQLTGEDATSFLGAVKEVGAHTVEKTINKLNSSIGKASHALLPFTLSNALAPAAPTPPLPPKPQPQPPIGGRVACLLRKLLLLLLFALFCDE